MPLIKSYSVGSGDMYYIRHGSDNFTIIDCCIPRDRLANILPELTTQSKDKGCTRFISTHPDQDHISGLAVLDDHLSLRNFYCVENQAEKLHPTVDFTRYVELRDSSKAFYIHEGVRRKWMNEHDDNRGSAGLTVLWPDTSDTDFQSALADAADGMPPNNISPIMRYAVEGGPSMLWMGDLESDFMEKIADRITLKHVDVLFAPHHGRASGKVPRKWLEQLSPGLVVIGNAPSEYLDYYCGYDIITQNRAGDLLFETSGKALHIYSGSDTYVAEFLRDDRRDTLNGLYYVGTLDAS